MRAKCSRYLRFAEVDDECVYETLARLFPNFYRGKIMQTASYDVIVVGAGNAALCAALAAHEQGAKVLVLERAPIEQRGGNSAFTGGGFRCVYHGLNDILKFVPDLSPE